MRKGRAQRKSRSSRVPTPPPGKVKSKPSQLAAQPHVAAASSDDARQARETAEVADAVKTEPSPKLDLSTVVTPLEPASSPESLDAVVTVVAANPASEPPLALNVAAHDDLPRATGPDEISIPPAGDLAVDEKFFSEGDVGAHLTAEDLKADDAWEEADKAKRAKHHPHVVERRQRFARYVGLAVAGATVLCVAALARTAFTPRATETGRSVAAANALVVAPPPPAAAPAAPAAAPAPAKEEEKAVEIKAPEPKAAQADQAPVPEAKAEAAKADPPADAKTAREEKNASRNALESRKLDEAIAAGERSVALDAEDGEAWLILGAAYQEKGKLADARRCYAACLKEGKRGPKNECAAMLR